MNHVCIYVIYIYVDKLPILNQFHQFLTVAIDVYVALCVFDN